MVKKYILLLVFINTAFITFGKTIIYETDQYVYTVNGEYKFDEAIRFCNSFPSSQIALLKERNLASKIERRLVEIENGL